MPRLQIVDNKRIVEKKKREPGVKVKKVKNKEKKGKPTGTNDAGSGKMRSWGDGNEDTTVLDPAEAGKRGYSDVAKPPIDGKVKKRKHADDGVDAQAPATDKLDRADIAKFKKVKRDIAASGTAKPTPAVTSSAAQPSATKVADPSTLTSDKAHRHSKNETGVYGVVEVAKGDENGARASKGKKDKKKVKGNVPETGTTGGIDLKAVFGQSDESGLGVGSW
jgi:hypothetical protein